MKHLFLILFLTGLSVNAQLPKGFSYVKDICPSIKSELCYYGHHNFVGVPIEGYEKNILITSTATAKALKKVQTELRKKGLGLKIFDAYRPQRAVNHFVRWTKKTNDTLNKHEFYPTINKRNLFKLGYISTKSGHSRGSSIDITLIDLKTNKEIDMGSPYDFFGAISATYSKKITKKQLQNRLLLRSVMIKHGFRAYSKREWWHFTLRNEPFPKTYFDFLVK